MVRTIYKPLFRSDDFVFLASPETIVGVNKYRLAQEEAIDVLVVDNTKVREQQVTVNKQNSSLSLNFADLLSGTDFVSVGENKAN